MSRRRRPAAVVSAPRAGRSGLCADPREALRLPPLAGISPPALSRADPGATSASLFAAGRASGRRARRRAGMRCANPGWAGLADSSPFDTRPLIGESHGWTGEALRLERSSRARRRAATSGSPGCAFPGRCPPGCLAPPPSEPIPPKPLAAVAAERLPSRRPCRRSRWTGATASSAVSSCIGCYKAFPIARNRARYGCANFSVLAGACADPGGTGRNPRRDDGRADRPWFCRAVGAGIAGRGAGRRADPRRYPGRVACAVGPDPPHRRHPRARACHRFQDPAAGSGVGRRGSFRYICGSSRCIAPRSPAFTATARSNARCCGPMDRVLTPISPALLDQQFSAGISLSRSRIPARRRGAAARRARCRARLRRPPHRRESRAARRCRPASAAALEAQPAADDLASPAIGVRQDPSSAASMRPLGATQAAVVGSCSGASSAHLLVDRPGIRSPARPCPTAGSMISARQDLARAGRLAEPFEPAQRQHQCIDLAGLQLARAGCSHCRGSARPRDPGACRSNWASPPQRSGADPRAGRQIAEARPPLDRPARRAGRRAAARSRSRDPSGSTGLHILQRMHRQIDAPVEQRLLDLLGEQPLAADLGEQAGPAPGRRSCGSSPSRPPRRRPARDGRRAAGRGRARPGTAPSGCRGFRCEEAGSARACVPLYYRWSCSNPSRLPGKPRPK